MGLQALVLLAAAAATRSLRCATLRQWWVAICFFFFAILWTKLNNIYHVLHIVRHLTTQRSHTQHSGHCLLLLRVARTPLPLLAVARGAVAAGTTRRKRMAPLEVVLLPNPAVVATPAPILLSTHTCLVAEWQSNLCCTVSYNSVNNSDDFRNSFFKANFHQHESSIVNHQPVSSLH